MRDETIVFNLQSWLATEAPEVETVAGGFLEDSTEDIVALIDNGGMIRPWFPRSDIAIQTLSRGTSRVDAGRRANELASVMRGRFGGEELPEVTVEGEIYPAVTAWAFLPQSKPGYIGIDKNRLHMWSANYIIVIGG